MDAAKSYFAELTANLDGMTQLHDVLLSPVLATAAPKLGPQGPLIPGDQLKQNVLDYVNYTPVYNISGQPAMSVPLGASFSCSTGVIEILRKLFVTLLLAVVIMEPGH